MSSTSGSRYFLKSSLGSLKMSRNALGLASIGVSFPPHNKYYLHCASGNAYGMWKVFVSWITRVSNAASLDPAYRPSVRFLRRYVLTELRFGFFHLLSTSLCRRLAMSSMTMPKMKSARDILEHIPCIVGCIDRSDCAERPASSACITWS